MVTSICAYIQSTCNKHGCNISEIINCQPTTFHCRLVQSRIVLTTWTQRPCCLPTEPVSAWKKSRQQCSERWKCSTFVQTAERFTGRAAIMRKYTRNILMFFQWTATADCDIIDVVLYTVCDHWHKTNVSCVLQCQNYPMHLLANITDLLKE